MCLNDTAAKDVLCSAIGTSFWRGENLASLSQMHRVGKEWHNELRDFTCVQFEYICIAIV